jgi:hypothetical protein
MPFNIDAQVVTLSADQLDDLFKDIPSSTPTANDLPTGQEGTKADATAKADSISTSIPMVDSSILDEPTTDDKPKPDEKKDEPVVAVEPDTTSDDTSTDDTSDVNVKEVLKNTVAHLIQTGLWEDFDGREDLEITDEIYAQLAIEQEQRKIQNLFSDLVDSTGRYGKAILSHLKNGGNPDDIIDIFKEQKQIEAIDTASEEGKLELIHRYYSDVIGWKPEKVKKHIQNLVTNPEDLTEEVGDIAEKYNEYYNQQLAEVEVQQKAIEAAEARKQQMFTQTISQHISQREDLTDREKKSLERSILDFRHDLKDGRKVNDFYVAFAQMQQDPQQYIDLVQFVTNREAYDQKILSKGETRAAEKTFKFIAGGAASNKKGTPATNPIQETTNKYKGTDFSGFLKRK